MYKLLPIIEDQMEKKRKTKSKLRFLGCVYVLLRAHIAHAKLNTFFTCPDKTTGKTMNT